MTPRPAWQWNGFAARFVTALAIFSTITASTFAYANWFANDQFGRSREIAGLGGVLDGEGSSTEPANYLIVGSDTRAFVNDPVARSHFGDPKYQTGQRADVIMIAHIDPKADNKGFLVSIPRDTWVSIPDHGSGKILGAYNYGPAMLINTIKQNFGIAIRHYLEVDFATFSAVVNAIGKVHIFFPAAAYDKKTGLEITSPGCKPLDGLQALAYARSRHYFYKTASGYKQDLRSDIGRIQRQQYFIRSLAQEALDKGGRNPLVAKRLVEKTVSHLAHDSEMHLDDFLLLANAFREVAPTALEMTTLPTERHFYGSADALAVRTEEAQPILDRLKNFTRTAKPPKIAPKDIRIQVLNGSGVTGAAGRAEAALVTRGFASGAAAGDADHSDYTVTEVRYAPGAGDKAKVVAAYLGGVGSVVPMTTESKNADVVVVLGRDFVAVTAPGQHPQTASTATTEPANLGSTPGSTVPATKAGLPAVGCG
jgi:LCP family protein required for cell wall assembly